MQARRSMAASGISSPLRKGNLPGAITHVGDIQDRDGAPDVIVGTQERFPTLAPLVRRWRKGLPRHRATMGRRAQLPLAGPMPPSRKRLRGHHSIFRFMAPDRLHPTYNEVHRKKLISIRIDFEGVKLRRRFEAEKAPAEQVIKDIKRRTLCSRAAGKDPHCAGRLARGREHCRTVPTRGYRPEPIRVSICLKLDPLRFGYWINVKIDNHFFGTAANECAVQILSVRSIEFLVGHPGGH